MHNFIARIVYPFDNLNQLAFDFIPKCHSSLLLE
jgi:hypothetical protein